MIIIYTFSLNKKNTGPVRFKTSSEHIKSEVKDNNKDVVLRFADGTALFILLTPEGVEMLPSNQLVPDDDKTFRLF